MASMAYSTKAMSVCRLHVMVSSAYLGRDGPANVSYITKRKGAYLWREGVDTTVVLGAVVMLVYLGHLLATVGVEADGG